MSTTKRDAVDETKRHLERADESARRTGDKELVKKVDDAHQHIKKHIDPQAPPKSASSTAWPQVQTCTCCAGEYPFPVELHHDQAECDAAQGQG